MIDQELSEILKTIETQIATLKEDAIRYDRAMQAIFEAVRETLRYSTPKGLQDSGD